MPHVVHNLMQKQSLKIRADNTKKNATRRAQLDEKTKSKIQADNTKKHASRRAQLDEETKSKIQADDTMKHATRRAQLDEKTKSKIRADETKNRKKQRLDAKLRKEAAFKAVKGRSMSDPSILNTRAYEILSQEVFDAFKQGPEYECTICLKLEFKRSVIRLDDSRYDEMVFEKCYQKKSEWVCKSCDKWMKKGKTPPQAQANDMCMSKNS